VKQVGRKKKRGGGLGIGGTVGEHVVAAGLVWRKKKRKRR